MMLKVGTNISKKAQTRLFSVITKMQSKSTAQPNSRELLCALESKKGRISAVAEQTQNGLSGDARISIGGILMKINLDLLQITSFKTPELLPEFIAKIKINKFLKHISKNFENETIVKRGIAKMHYMKKEDVDALQKTQAEILAKEFTVLSQKPMAMDDSGFEKLKAAYKDIEDDKYSKLMIIDEDGAEKIKAAHRQIRAEDKNSTT